MLMMEPIQKPAMHRLEGRVRCVVVAGFHAVGADDRPQHADAAHEQREDDALVAKLAIPRIIAATIVTS